MKYPTVYIEKVEFEESNYVRGEYKWAASTLYNKVKKDKLKPFDYLLVAFSTLSDGFRVSNIDDFIFHCKRVKDCDKSIPIILDDYGQIAHGYHRVCRAILDGDTFIKAYRLNTMPEVDEIIKENED